MFEKVIILTLQVDYNVNQDLEIASHYGGLGNAGNFLSITTTKNSCCNKCKNKTMPAVEAVAAIAGTAAIIKLHQHTHRYCYTSQIRFKQYFRNQMKLVLQIHSRLMRSATWRSFV